MKLTALALEGIARILDELEEKTNRPHHVCRVTALDGYAFAAVSNDMGPAGVVLATQYGGAVHAATVAQARADADDVRHREERILGV